MTGKFDFSKLDKAHQKTRLCVEFGKYIKPLTELSDSPTTPTIIDYLTALTIIHQDSPRWWQHARIFGTIDGIPLHKVGEKLANLVSDVLTGFETNLYTTSDLR